MARDSRKIGEILIEIGALNETTLEAALSQQQPGGPRIGRILVDRSLISERDLVQALARQSGLPFVSLRHLDVDGEALTLLPREIAARHCCVPVGVQREAGERVLVVALNDPDDPQALSELAAVSALPIRPVLAESRDIQAAIDRFFEARPAGREGKPPSPQPAGEGAAAAGAAEEEATEVAPDQLLSLDAAEEAAGAEAEADDDAETPDEVAAGAPAEEDTDPGRAPPQGKAAEGEGESETTELDAPPSAENLAPQGPVDGELGARVEQIAADLLAAFPEAGEARAYAAVVRAAVTAGRFSWDDFLTALGADEE